MGGADNEYVRIIFDFSFFLFITLILLAIIQGFIIDAFGALRDQLQGVEDELAGNCFICSISKDYLDGVPHGFDTHVQKEHNLANYLFFLMYLINKDESDYTGQETYVWNMYQERCWDFFPAGDCFRKQYEDELGLGGRRRIKGIFRHVCLVIHPAVVLFKMWLEHAQLTCTYCSTSIPTH